MEHLLKLPQLESGELKLVTADFFGKPKLYWNGIEVEKRNDRYAINNHSDTPILVTLKNNYLDPVPKVFVNNEQVHFAKEITWYEYIWTGLPVLMALQGGLMGALLGLISLRINLNIFRGNRSTPIKYLLTFGVSFAFATIFLALAVFVTSLIYQE